MSGQRFRIGFKPSRAAGRVDIWQTWTSVDLTATGERLEVMLFHLGEMEEPLALKNNSPRALVLVRVIEDEEADPLRLEPGDCALLELVDGRLVSVLLEGRAR